MVDTNLSRRHFLTGRSRGRSGAILPPGLDAAALAGCDGCGDCSRHCPAGIVVLRDGLPELDFRRGECSFCGECAGHCPRGLFAGESVSRLPVVAGIGPSCLAVNFVDCQSCRDACPTAAIRFRPRRGGPFVPELDPSACTGCGACLSVCPADAVTFAVPLREPAHA